MADVRLRLAVFRLQLFKPSEPFVADQVAALPAADALLLGRSCFGPPDSRLAYWCPRGARRHLFPFYSAFGAPDLYLPPVRAHRARLVHAHFAVDALYALGTADRLGIPLITTLHGFDITTSRAHFLRSGRPALVRYALMQKRLKREGAVFICVSDFIRERALAAGFPAAKLVRHYIGIEPDAFTLAAHDGPPHVVHIARLVEKKGTAYLLDAMARLRTRHPEATLTVIGDGPLGDALKGRARALGIESAVRFAGARPHDEICELLRRACVLVLPSVSAASGDAEGLGLVLLEAAASGVPVIGTRHGGIPEAVRDGESGLLVPERDAAAIADALDALLSDAGLRRRMGAAGRRLVEDRFDVRRQSAALQVLYEQAL